MYHFKCKGCGTKYSSPQPTPPPTPRWSDGHVCELEPVKEK